MPDVALIALTLCRTSLFSSFVYKSIKTNSFLDGSLTFVSYTLIIDFARALFTIEKSKQDIQEMRDLCEQVAIFLGSVSCREIEANRNMPRKCFAGSA